MINNTISEKNNPRSIKRIVVHCTAGWQKQTIEELLMEFKERGWKNPGYHYVVKTDGTIVSLLPETFVSNGAAGYNQTSIHISYFGGIAKSNGKIVPVDNRTAHQKNALRVALKILKTKYPKAIILGHRDLSPDLNKDGKITPNEYIKACPCFDAKIEYADIKP